MSRKQILSIAFVTASALCALAVVPLFAQTSEPSLGEVARKNRAAQAKARAAKPKVAEENTPSRPMSTATVTNYGSSASLAPASTDTNSSASQPNGESNSGSNSTADSQSDSATTPKDVTAAGKPEPEVDRVTQLKKDQESLTSMIEQLRAKAEAATDDARRQTLNEVIRNAEAELEKKQQELSEAERSAPKK